MKRDVSRTQRSIRVSRIPVEPLRDLLPGNSYATCRWTTIVIPVATGAPDIPTIVEWAHVTGHSRATLKQWCINAGAGTSDSLDFARALRLTIRYAGSICDWFNELAIVDNRTLLRFLRRSGFDKNSTVPLVDVFLQTQRYVGSPALLTAVRRQLPNISGPIT